MLIFLRMRFENFYQPMCDCLECVASQLVWTNTLSNVLTSQGVPDNTAVGTYHPRLAESLSCEASSLLYLSSSAFCNRQSAVHRLDWIGFSKV